MAPVKYTSYSKSKAGRRSDVAMMRAADRATAAYYARQRSPMEGIDYPTRSYPAPQRVPRPMARAGEIKGMDTDLAYSPVIATTSTNAGCTVLNLIQAGTGSWNRVGKKVNLKSLRLVGSVTFQLTPTFATGACSDTFVRMVVVYDRQPSGAAIPAFDTVFGTTVQTGTEATISITDPLRYDNMERFRVIRDVCIDNDQSNVPAFGSAPTQVNVVPFDEFVKLKGLDTVFSGQSNPMTITDISTGALYVYFRSINNTSTVTAAIIGIARLRYYD